MQKSGKIFLRTLLLFSFLNSGFSPSIFAQTGSSSAIKKDSSQHPLLIQPILRVGVGVLSYIGDIESSSSNFQSPFKGRIGYDIGISQPLSPITEFSLNFLYGGLAQTEKIPGASWSFQSTIAGGGINLLFKILPEQNITPYAIIGVESYEFISSATIYDPNGVEYYSWSDGTLRSLPQTSPSASSAKILNLDNAYATSIRSVNIGGVGNYSQQTFAIPIGIGLMYHLCTRADFMLGSTLHYTFNNHIDGLTPQSEGALKNDMFIYSYATLRINLTKDYPKSDKNDVPVFASVRKDTIPAPKKQVDTIPVAAPVLVLKNADTTAKIPYNYTVQILAIRNKFKDGKTFAGIGDKVSLEEENGIYKYSTGNFTQYSDAEKYLAQLRDLGYADAFIRATQNGKNVPVPPHHLRQDSLTKNAMQAPPPVITPKQAAVMTTIHKDTTTVAKTELVFKIQLGTYTTAPDQDFMNMYNKFPDGSLVKDSAGVSHYMAGSYTDFQTAMTARDKAEADGVKNASIKALYNGQFISIPEAMDMIKK